MVNTKKIKSLVGEKDVEANVKKIGISRQTYYNLINTGKGNIATLEKIADFFKVFVDDLFDRNIRISHTLHAFDDNHITQPMKEENRIQETILTPESALVKMGQLIDIIASQQRTIDRLTTEKSQPRVLEADASCAAASGY
jgi:DNA-binding XRE family transcriptional regulator